MTNKIFKLLFHVQFVLLALCLFVHISQASELRLAVASNFYPIMKELVARYQKSTDQQVLISSGSTGKHYAQIINGAPFDVFFAADKNRPQLLESAGKGIANSRFTYAIGRLVLWSPSPEYIGDTQSIIGGKDFRFIAIANPRLAPYGKAAKQVMEKYDIWQKYSPRIVRGENVAQAFKFVVSGNAQMGFVAYSQVLSAPGITKQHYIVLDSSLYDPIEQQAILIKETRESLAFVKFMKSENAREIIIRYGYDVPD